MRTQNDIGGTKLQGQVVWNFLTVMDILPTLRYQFFLEIFKFRRYLVTEYFGLLYE